MNAQESIAITEADASIKEFNTYQKYSRKCVYDITLDDAFEDHQPQSNLFTRIKMNSGLLYYPSVIADQYVCYYHSKLVYMPLTDQSYPSIEEAVSNAANNWNEIRRECEIDTPLKMKIFHVKENYTN